jgi:hypothetical protein
VLESRLPDATCDALYELAAEAECDLIGGTGSKRARFEPGQPIAVRYDIPEEILLRSEAVQVLLADRSILSIAQRYLGGAPIQDLVAMWWTAAAAVESSPAAQEFHFDLDRLRFLKLFVYLTDVGPDNGPHVLVRGTHRDLPRELRADRRFATSEVSDHFDPARSISVTGPRGTMFFADTRALHRGTRVSVGHRLVFQLEYATSLFGAPFTSARIERPSPVLLDAMRAYPSTYGRYELHPEVARAES